MVGRGMAVGEGATVLVGSVVDVARMGDAVEVIGREVGVSSAGLEAQAVNNRVMKNRDVNR